MGRIASDCKYGNTLFSFQFVFYEFELFISRFSARKFRTIVKIFNISTNVIMFNDIYEKGVIECKSRSHRPSLCTRHCAKSREICLRNSALQTLLSHIEESHALCHVFMVLFTGPDCTA